MSARRSSRRPLAKLASTSMATAAALAALLGALALAGCGQMGPLVLPGSASEQSAADEAEDENESGAENEQ